jgi:hypothetical protein
LLKFEPKRVEARYPWYTVKTSPKSALAPANGLETQFEGIARRKTPLRMHERAANPRRGPEPVATIPIQRAPSAKNRMGTSTSLIDFATTPTEKCRSYNHISCRDNPG